MIVFLGDVCRAGVVIGGICIDGDEGGDRRRTAEYRAAPAAGTHRTGIIPNETFLDVVS